MAASLLVPTLSLVPEWPGAPELLEVVVVAALRRLSAAAGSAPASGAGVQTMT